MADQPTITPGLTRPPQPPSPPGVPVRPSGPPPGVGIRDTNLANVSPSPSPFVTRPATPAPPTKPLPTPLPTPPAPLKSSIRTMGDDLQQKKPIPVPLQSMATPTIPKPITVPTPQSSNRSSSINIPPPEEGSKKSGKRLLIIGIGGLVLIGLAMLGYGILGGSDEPEATPTPSPTITPTPTPIPLNFERIFLPETALTYATSGNASLANTEITTSITSKQVGLGEIKTYSVTSNAFEAKTFGQFGTDLGLNLPPALLSSVDSSVWYFVLFGKTDGTKGRGVALKINNEIALQAALNAWEPAISESLKTLFKFDTRRAASTSFLSNLYQGISIRYRNFPDAQTTIDYATIGMPDVTHYLFIVNSRDQIYRIIDKAK